MQIEAKIKQSGDHYDTRVYQTMHNVGGAITGAGVFPQNIGYKPFGFGWRTDLLVRQGYSHDIFESARTSGAGLSME